MAGSAFVIALVLLDPTIDGEQVRQYVAEMLAGVPVVVRVGEPCGDVNVYVGCSCGRFVGCCWGAMAHVDSRRAVRLSRWWLWRRPTRAEASRIVATVAAHEVGHALGLKHGKGLMRRWFSMRPVRRRFTPEQKAEMRLWLGR